VGKDSKRASDASLIKLNELIGAMVVFVKRSKAPPLEELAVKFDMDVESVRKLYLSLLQSAGKSIDEMQP